MAEERHLRPPSVERLLLESLSVVEYGMLHLSPLHRFVKRGDGHPVLVLPGFGASDRSTWPLRRALRAYGHAAHGWDLGNNVGAHRRILRGMDRRLRELAEGAGESVSVVGWSLGGVFARELAREHLAIVRQVITMSAPFRFRDGDRGNASTLYDLIGPREDPYAGRLFAEHRRPPLEVPTTAIYTRSDGIVAWHTCIEEPGPRRENIEVIGTHTGIGFNPLTVIAVADRLALPAGEWRPFRPPTLLRGWYPRPASWRPREEAPISATR